MLELTVEKQLPKIITNFDLVKASLMENTKKYVGMIVTEDTLTDCKADQKQLASMRVKIDNYRKTVKKEISKPITEFEDKCKVLIGLIEDVEKPIKSGIEVFDNQRREDKRLDAQADISTMISQYELNPKYADQLTILDKYTNLTAKSKEVLNDIEGRAKLLLEQQNKDIEMLLMIKDSIEIANKTIKTPLALEDFQRLIDMGMSSREVIQEVNKRAERIVEAELKVIADALAKKEREKLEAEQRELVENAVIKIAEIHKEIIPIVNEKVIEELPFADFVEDIQQEIPVVEEMHYKDIRITGTFFDIVKAEQLLNENGFSISILDEGKFKEECF